MVSFGKIPTGNNDSFWKINNNQRSNVSGSNKEIQFNPETPTRENLQTRLERIGTGELSPKTGRDLDYYA